MRSVVLKTSRRCPQCHLAARWCVCSVERRIKSPVEIDVLMHHREAFRPSSTGHLINRIIPGSRHHVWRRERKMGPEQLVIPGRELWILHPQGMPLPTDVRPDKVQVVLLDGSWRETTAMAHEVRGW